MQYVQAIKMKKYHDKENLKIIMFGQKRIPSREGGVEIVVEELATRMVQLGHQVTCINRKGHHVSGSEFDGERLDEHEGVKILSVPTIKKKGLAAASSAFFASFKAAFGNYDVVHIHAEGPAAFCWIPKLLGKKVISTCHGIDWKRPRWQGTIGRKFIKYGERMMVKYSDAIIVLSHDIQKYFNDAYGKNTVFIPNGVDKPNIEPINEINKKWSLTKNSYILVLARLTEEKNIHLLIEAYKRINIDKKLVIAGGSSDSDKYINLLYDLAGKDPRIIFTGFVQGKLLKELYSNAYIYCLPSELEGMPLSLLEAMSYGNCCLVSDIPECRDVVENMAVTFLSKNIVDLEEKLKKLCENPILVEYYKNNASDFICKKYNWDDVVNKTLFVYKSIWS